MSGSIKELTAACAFAGERSTGTDSGVFLLVGVVAAVCLTTASKLAFIGWGVGRGWPDGRGTVTAAVLLRRASPLPVLRPWLAMAAALWLLAMPVKAPPSASHTAVTQLALELSGNGLPYLRADRLRRN